MAALQQSSKFCENGDVSIDTILNRTPLTDHTNQHVISDKLPNVYLAKLIADNGRQAVEDILASHFISPKALDILPRDLFSPADFDAFIRDRQRTIAHAVQSLLIGGRADLPADLRALDEAVERIELRLRAIIAERLGNDIDQLPPSVREKMDPKIAGEIKRNPGGDPDRYARLDRALEFADITELLGVMTARGEGRFQDLFPAKDALITRFGQLCGLRNPIRHSRQVSDIARHDGEAAIKWFEQALAAPSVAAASPAL